MGTKQGRFNESYFRKKLSAAEYHILRQKGTEPPFSGRYLYCDESGTYYCRACGQRLFSSRHKCQSGSGWPSFNKALSGAVQIRPDFRHFMIRREVLCRRCGSHLGHLFYDGFCVPDIRYCINSAALKFRKGK